MSCFLCLYPSSSSHIRRRAFVFSSCVVALCSWSLNCCSVVDIPCSMLLICASVVPYGIVVVNMSLRSVMSHRGVRFVMAWVRCCTQSFVASWRSCHPIGFGGCRVARSVAFHPAPLRSIVCPQVSSHVSAYAPSCNAPVADDVIDHAFALLALNVPAPSVASFVWGPLLVRCPPPRGGVRAGVGGCCCGRVRSCLVVARCGMCSCRCCGVCVCVTSCPREQALCTSACPVGEALPCGPVRLASVVVVPSCCGLWSVSSCRPVCSVVVLGLFVGIACRCELWSRAATPTPLVTPWTECA